MNKINKSKQSKKHKAIAFVKKHKVASVFIALVALVFFYIIFYIAFSAIQNELARRNLMAAKADILALQKELNKVDSGWEYGESCGRSHDVFETGPIYCRTFIEKKYQIIKKMNLMN